MAHRLLRDPEADGWERSDFPIVCEECLGPNPYVRMQKEEYGMECHISGRPFTVFRWRPGQDARYKKTVICREVALAKNVCQCCVLDLDTGLPVQVRDAALGVTSDALPQSDVGKEYAVAQIAQQMADGTYKQGAEYGASANNEVLRRLARTAPTYKRNRARICTFWLRNACTRTDCPFRPCNGDTDMPELNSDPALRTQNIKDRYHGVNDPVAEKMLRRAAASGADKALTPPEDPSVTTLFVGGLDERVDEESLKDHFYPFGEIASIRVVRDRKCAFVTFTARAAAEKAAEGLGGGALVVKGLRLKLMWGKPVAKREPGAAAAGAPGMPPPPWGALPPGMPPGWAPPQGMRMPPMPMPMPGGAAPPPMLAAGGAAAYAAFYPSMDPAAMGTTRGGAGGAGAAAGAPRQQ